MSWPSQKEQELNAFYGNPRSNRPGVASKTWVAKNIVNMPVVYPMTYDGKRVKTIQVHRKCVDAFTEVFTEIWDKCGHNQKMIDDLGASIYGGAYNFRLMRNGRSLSMHSWGCAIDLDPVRNPYNSKSHHFKEGDIVVTAFKRVGATWGGNWRSPDSMHFQLANL